MKYIIDGKPAYAIAKRNGVSSALLYWRINKKYWSVKDAATISPHKKGKGSFKYLIRKDGQYVCTCRTTTDVAKVIGTTKGAICGLFFRHGNEIELFGYTIKRRGLK